MAKDYPDFTPIKNDVRTTADTTRGGAATFDTSKYKVDHHVYPSDLLGTGNNGKNAYGGNYVIFYINVSSESKLLKNAENVTVDDLTPRERGFTVGSNLTLTQAAASSTIGGAVEGGTVGAILGGGAGVVLGAAAGIGFSVAGKDMIIDQTVSGNSLSEKTTNASKVGTFSRAQKRLQQVIALHVPSNLAVKYGVGWNEDETALFSMVAEGSADAWEAIKSGLTKGTDISTITETVGNTIKGISSIAAAVALNASFGKSALSAGTGIASNPKKEQIFDGVNFRVFTFEYSFFPRDAKEEQAIKNIIYNFKLHMHPEYKDANNFLYLYPSEFDIVYYKDGKENLNLHRHTSCVLTDMTVNYTPNGTFTTFENGMPQQINVTLTFKELGLLSKEKIEDNY